MMFALICTAFLASLVTVIASWPFFGGASFFVAPFGASLATFAVAAVLARRNPHIAQESIDVITDRLVADLRAMTDAAARPARAVPDLQRKAG
jgi:membrane associated rhomboid family serine protease